MKGWDNDKYDQNMLEQICYKHSLLIVTDHNVDLLALRAVVLVIWVASCCTLMLAYDMTELLVVKLICYLYSALLSSSYCVSHLLETIHNGVFYLFSSWDPIRGRDTSIRLPLLLQANYYSSCKFQISLGCSSQQGFITVFWLCSRSCWTTI